MAGIKTPKAIFSYPALFKQDKNGKYSLTLVFPAGTDLKALKQAALDVVIEKFGKENVAKMIKQGKIKFEGGPHHAFRTDVKGKGYPEGSTFISARATRRPGVVGIIPDPQTGKPMPITDEEQIYPGVIGRASVTAFYYDVSGNKGIGFALNNVQKLRDGDRLDGRVKAEDEFEADESAAASLEDLEDTSAQEDEPEQKPARKGKAAKAEPEEDLAALLS